MSFWFSVFHARSTSKGRVFPVSTLLLFILSFSLSSPYLHEPSEPFIGLVLRRDRSRPRKLQLGQLDLGLAVVDPGGDLAPGAPLVDGLFLSFGFWCLEVEVRG